MTKVRLSPLALYSVLAYTFILLPILVVVLTSFTGAGYVTFPPKSWGIKGYIDLMNRPEFIASFRVSLVVAAGASVASTTLGILAALGLTRYRFPGRDFLSTFFLSPLMLPTIVLGLAILLVYNQVGITKTPFSIVVGHIVVTSPYVIRLVGASLAGFDRSLELAARNLGASAWMTFFKITLPIIMPGVIAGATFAFITSWNEVNVAIFLSSSTMTTLPVRIFSYIEVSAVDPMITAVGSVLVIIAGIALVVIERTMGLGKVFGAR